MERRGPAARERPDGTLLDCADLADPGYTLDGYLAAYDPAVWGRVDPSRYGIATTCGAGVLVEGNSFENLTDPTHVGEGSSPTGNLVERSNLYVNSGAPQTAGSVAAIPYAYTLDAASTVKATVTAGAGTGKISG